ncbi:hypothetical protein AMTR_s00008p00179110 [Amborella trichopoda]|uniref:Uncharacterized protein n=1 Tax=Amborella trichopoda TaxID=13333 RepID=W1NIL8_AMBTC|nr:hypothetical protein AMTR_s00008p00179110 [Amborella trichopoda]
MVAAEDTHILFACPFLALLPLPLLRVHTEPEVIIFQAQVSELHPLVDMKEIKGLRFINKKLKSLTPSLVVTALKTSLEARVLQLNAIDGGGLMILSSRPFHLATPSQRQKCSINPKSHLAIRTIV